MNNKVLLVDDDLNVLQAYTRTLRGHFRISTADNGTDGIQILKEEGPFAVVVTDFRMPEMDGIQFLTQAKEFAPDTIRIMLSGQADLEVSIQAVNEGNIFRFLNKPCPTDQLIKVLCTAIEQYRLVMSERELLEKTLKGSVKLLLDISNAVNPRTFSRASRLRTTANAIAVRLKVENSWEVELAAMLSQIGCTTIPPLRHRSEDIFDLVPYFVQKACAALGKCEMSVSEEVLARLIAYRWPGNIRELENCITSMVTMADRPLLRSCDLPEEVACHSPARLPANDTMITQHTKQIILQALFQTKGKIAPAAHLLGMGRSTLYRKLKQLDIQL